MHPDEIKKEFGKSWLDACFVDEDHVQQFSYICTFKKKKKNRAVFQSFAQLINQHFQRHRKLRSIKCPGVAKWRLIKGSVYTHLQKRMNNQISKNKKDFRVNNKTAEEPINK